MRIHVSLSAVVMALLVASMASAQGVGSTVLPWAVLADGKRLSAGTYEMRVTSEVPQTPVGQSHEAHEWMEFVLNGKVVGRELAIVLRDDDLDAHLRGPKPREEGARVDVLRGNDYVRIWIHHAGDNYLLHLPRVQ